MNFKNILFASAVVAIMASCGQSYKKQSAIITRTDSVSYVLGGVYGGRQMSLYEQYGLDTLLDFNRYFEAFYNSGNHKPLKYELDSVNDQYLNEFIVLLQVYNQRMALDTTGNVSGLALTKSRLDSVSYLLGIADGITFSNMFPYAGLDTVGLDFNLFYEGYREIVQDDKTRVDIENNTDIVSNFFAEIQEKEMLSRFGDVKREGEEFLARNKANSDVVTTASGLQYIVLKEGKGPKPVMFDRVKVHYTGTFIDGSVFDSSILRGEPVEFTLGTVIAGWNEALTLMPVGSKWKLFVPQELAYGWQGRSQIKPYSMLIFEVELLDIIK